MSRLTKAKGIKIFQAKVTSWSNRTRGKVQRNHMNIKTKA